jgi:cation diffusion facilitator CzcD-associated flavoprotein CzcO/acetyl esterase/lipase
MMRGRLRVEVVRSLTRVAAPMLAGASLPIEHQRRRADLLGRLLRTPRGVHAQPITLGGVPGERLSSEEAGTGALLYLHGGGYCIGSPRSHRALAAALALGAGAVAYSLDYRLAPEHPHPAALVDALAAYHALLESGTAPEQIVVAGDSAGGGLALALAMSLRDTGAPLPSALALICPWLDLVPDLEGTRAPSSGEALLSCEALSLWARAYVGGSSAKNPAISPLHGDLDGLPPVILHSAADDLLAGDAERLAARIPQLLGHTRLEGLWHDPHMLRDVLPDADDAVTSLAGEIGAQLQGRRPRVAIVGAGMSGLCVADALTQAGFPDFTLYEKGDEVGGTWRENRYPGLSCDVPSRFYSFSFSPNPAWTSAFSPGPEIQRYFVGVADRRGLRPRIRFETAITSARWQDGSWALQSAGGETFDADVLVTATGVLHHPRLPEIPGRETFAGAAFHSARWEDAVSLDGKRVAVIGTGSTGVQITSAVAGQPARLMLFQRTPQWILPIRNRAYPRLSRAMMQRFPALNRLAYRYQQRSLEAILGPAVTRPGWQRSVISAACRANLRFGVRDPELRARLTPDYEPMCKRLVMSSEFYPALQRDDVELVTDEIERIEPRGIVTADGSLHELDVIVYATGFDAHAYMRPMEIVGDQGRTLEQAWAEGPRAYLTVAIPGFPNLFTMMGPHSPIGNHSLIAVAEVQAAYAVQWISKLAREGLRSFAPTQAATDAYYTSLKAAFPDTVWVTGCNSWYLDADGDPELWPWTPARHRNMLAAPEPRDFVID